MPAFSSLHRRLRVLSVPVLGAMLLAGCASPPPADTPLGRIARFFSPYKAEIVQGSVITREQIALIKPGKSRTEVRDILGSPPVADVFHAQRWDYPFALRRAGEEVQHRHVVIVFEGDVVKSVQAPELPSERDFVASLLPARKASEPMPRLALSPAERAALPAPPPPAARPSAPQGANRSYPPLESL